MRPKITGSPRGFELLFSDRYFILPRPGTSTLAPLTHAHRLPTSASTSSLTLRASIERPASTRLAAAIQYTSSHTHHATVRRKDPPFPIPPSRPFALVQLRAALARACDIDRPAPPASRRLRGCLVIRCSRPRLTLRNKAQKVAEELLEGARNIRNARGPV